MSDLTNPKLIKLKGGLFLIIGVLSSALLLAHAPTTTVALLLVIAIWSFCRFYYFAFYVIQHYVEPGFDSQACGRLPSISSMGRSLVSNRRSKPSLALLRFGDGLFCRLRLERFAGSRFGLCWLGRSLCSFGRRGLQTGLHRGNLFLYRLCGFPGVLYGPGGNHRFSLGGAVAHDRASDCADHRADWTCNRASDHRAGHAACGLLGNREITLWRLGRAFLFHDCRSIGKPSGCKDRLKIIDLG